MLNNVCGKSKFEMTGECDYVFIIFNLYIPMAIGHLISLTIIIVATAIRAVAY